MSGELRLRQTSCKPQIAHTFTDIARTRHVDSLSGRNQAVGVPT
jgi:hypothetical protein